MKLGEMAQDSLSPQKELQNSQALLETQIFRSTLGEWTRELGPRHQAVMALTASLAATLHAHGQISEAILVCEEALGKTVRAKTNAATQHAVPSAPAREILLVDYPCCTSDGSESPFLKTDEAPALWELDLKSEQFAIFETRSLSSSIENVERLRQTNEATTATTATAATTATTTSTTTTKSNPNPDALASGSSHTNSHTKLEPESKFADERPNLDTQTQNGDDLGRQSESKHNNRDHHDRKTDVFTNNNHDTDTDTASNIPADRFQAREKVVLSERTEQKEEVGIGNFQIDNTEESTRLRSASVQTDCAGNNDNDNNNNNNDNSIRQRDPASSIADVWSRVEMQGRVHVQNILAKALSHLGEHKRSESEYRKAMQVCVDLGWTEAHPLVRLLAAGALDNAARLLRNKASRPDKARMLEAEARSLLEEMFGPQEPSAFSSFQWVAGHPVGGRLFQSISEQMESERREDEREEEAMWKGRVMDKNEGERMGQVGQAEGNDVGGDTQSRTKVTDEVRHEMRDGGLASTSSECARRDFTTSASLPSTDGKLPLWLYMCVLCGVCLTYVALCALTGDFGFFQIQNYGEEYHSSGVVPT